MGGLEELYRDAVVGSDERITVQKLAVLRYLDENRETHPSVQEIFRAVRAKLGQITQVTVYRILRDFVRRGFLRTICVDPERVRFDPSTEPHHHAVCTNCGKIWNIPLESVECRAQMMPEDFVRGGNPEAVIRGLCTDCYEKRR